MHITLIDFNFFEYTISLANALTSEAKVSLLAPAEFENVADALSPEVELIYFVMPRLRSIRNLGMLRQIWLAIRNLRPDIVHLLAVNPWFNIGLILRHPVRLVTTIHDPVKHRGDASQRNIPQWVRDIPLRYSRQIIVHANAVKALLRERHSMLTSQVAVIPHGELAIYRHWNDRRWSELEGTVLFFGRIWPYKGLEYFIASEPIIAAACPQARFVIAGRGEDLGRYHAMMVHPDRFEVLNRYIPRDEVSRLFQQASVVVLPYIEASQSGVISLAYAFGKPVVGTAVGGIPEVIDDGETGLLVPPRDSKALAEAVISLLQDEERRCRMGERALEKAVKEMSWATVACQTIEVYRHVMSDVEGGFA